MTPASETPPPDASRRSARIATTAGPGWRLIQWLPVATTLCFGWLFALWMASPDALRAHPSGDVSAAHSPAFPWVADAAVATDSLTFMIGSWEMVTFVEESAGGWVPATDVPPADWSFGPAEAGEPEGGAGAIDGLGDLSMDGRAGASGRLQVYPGAAPGQILLEVTLGGLERARYRGGWLEGDQLLFDRIGIDPDEAHASGGGAGSATGPESGPAPFPDQIRLVVEARDRFVLVLGSGGSGANPDGSPVLLEFRRHQT